jgi:hypothetical protein
VVGGLHPDVVWYRIRPVGQPRSGLGERERRALRLAEVGRLAPRGDEVDALAALADLLELTRVESMQTLQPLI